jgi:hypothetical protein
MSIVENLQSIQQRIAAACDRSGRDPKEVELIAVSKGHSVASIREAADAGLTLFGENKVQELKLKRGQCPGNLRWEFIGHLQTNKCRDAVYFSNMIHSVDSERVAEALHIACEKLARSLPVLLEVNISGEATKYGFRPDEILSKLLQLNDYDRLEIHGFMCMAPWTKEPERTRTYFRQVKELQKEAEDVLGAPLPELSMGMSGDFEIAIEEGSTRIRLGTTLFGDRKQK